MPYDVRSNDPACPASKPWGLRKRDDNQLMGCHDTRDAAERQRAAIERNESENE